MKNLLSLSVCSLLALSATAQDNATTAGTTRVDYDKLRFGAYVAPNISWMKPTANTDDKKEFDVTNEGSKIGFTYGLMAEYYFAENYGLVLGLQVNSTGGKILAKRKEITTSPNAINAADFSYNLQFLEIPLALKLRTDEINKFRFFGQLGINAGFNIAKKVEYEVKYNDGNGAPQLATADRVKLKGGVGAIAPVLLSMSIGAGAEYPINNKLTAYAGLFFNNGFLPDATKPDLYDNDNLGYKGEFRDANTRLNNIALRVGLFF